jgi:hypothetical protein
VTVNFVAGKPYPGFAFDVRADRVVHGGDVIDRFCACRWRSRRAGA